MWETSADDGEALIALLTDFGTRDHYAGVMKGVMLSILPELTLVDLSHEVPAHDVAFAARELAAAYKFFPPGTIFLAVVDPGVGSGRRGIAAEAGDWKFVAPDNGVLAGVFQEAAPRRVVELTERRYARPTVSRTFEGRDRFAPAAAWLAKGIQLTALGRVITDFQGLNLPHPALTDGVLRGVVVRVDRFGNVVTNLDRRACERLTDAPGGLNLTVGGRAIARLVSTYADIAPGEIGALFGSTDHLECAAQSSSAATELGVAVGDPVELRRVCPNHDRPIAGPGNGAGGSEKAMLGFELTEEHRLLEKTTREWAARDVAPRIRDLDREHRFDRGILSQMAQLGLLGVSVPVEYGGAGMDYVSLGLASEELEYVDTSLRVIMSVHAGLNCLTLLTWGTEDQKQRYLVPQAQGTKLATYALTEPSAGSDVRGIQTVAVRRGTSYVLSGEKMWISLADICDQVLVFAWTDLDKKKRRDPGGLSAFIVERAFKGFSSGSMTYKWGILAGNTGYLKFDEVEVPEANLVGREGEGFKIAMFGLDQGRFTVAAGATGLIRACRDASVKYALDRRAFGVEIGQHQLVKEMLARMESDYQAARLLWLRAGWMKNQGLRNTRETGLAKWFATVASERAAGDAVQVHGANGYSDEYPVGRFYRNCKGAVIYEGTREIHTVMQADYLLGYRQDKPTRCELPPYSGR